MADVSGSPVVDTPASMEEKPVDDAPQDSNKDEGKAEGENEESLDPEMYRYIKEDLFTSEIYKVEIQESPQVHRLQRPEEVPGQTRPQPAQNQAVRQAERSPSSPSRTRGARQGHEDGARHAGGRASVQIANVVTPLWNVPYEEQLKRKEQEVVGVLQRLAKEIGSTNKALLPWLFAQKGKYNRMCCSLEAIRPSPVQTEYRNKCEFLISMGADGVDKTIGFRMGKYKGGSCAVVGPGETTHVSAEAKRVVSAFQKFISPETYEGHWKQLTVRTTRTKQAMAMAFFNPQKLDEEEVGALKNSMKTYFTEGEGKDSGVTSLYFIREGQRTSPTLEGLPCELVSGEGSIHEEMLGLKFRISPHSFFQVNTSAAEVLYSAVGEWAQLSEDSTVLDVCCGTGTIGISLAKRVKKVIGIEMCQEAVEDAKVNAKLNGLSNIEFHCGKAEDVFPNILNALVSPNLTAIVDPPRAGLHSKVILAIRRAEHLKRLVYVACNAKAAMNNFIDLCRAPSKRVHGAAFRPVRAMAVDLFPQTMHLEMLLLLERVDYDSKQ
ncbi:hypothetical protein JOQ06_011947 [Pogonophryne albipinna]|uniref:tRNA (uracil(54)-C(5))-methyltransferase n=1 Tax=Pogonophryne albipinna TaxID=1090488 RepID=A0AAD6BFV1_9TELE|nr:hypothetical protein JOQ06_011947 [Pogonophryne albipinna]